MTDTIISGSMFDPNWCDAHGGIHTAGVIEVHCKAGEHCTAFDASCNASRQVDDHACICCVCKECSLTPVEVPS
jgi:hypothetical protein